MNRGKQCNQIIEKYYDEIVRYCFFLLKDDFRGAEDCAHDAFLLLLRKQNELDLEQNIRGWLYASANRIVKDYRKKQLKFQAMLDYVREDDVVVVSDFSRLARSTKDVLQIVQDLTDKGVDLISI